MLVLLIAPKKYKMICMGINYYAIISEAVWDTLLAMPFLVFAFFVIDIIQHRFGDGAKEKLFNLGKWGPFYGALLGSLPQCGFSVIASSLFVARIISPGTLLAVYIATSDEAIPILFANPEAFSTTIIPLVVFKIGSGIFAGLLTDMVWHNHVNYLPLKKNLDHDHNYGQSCIGEVKPLSSIFRHALKHAAEVAFFLFLATIALNIMFTGISKDMLGYWGQHKLYQPVIAAIFGLIPNCATSVVITQAYIMKMLTFGALFAGLSSNAGFGLLVLFKQSKAKKDAVKIVVLLLVFSIGFGVIADLLI